MSTKTLAPAKTPTVAMARVLRGLGLTQGSDFRVKGMYNHNRLRIGTRVQLMTRRADAVVAEHATEIERLTGESGFPFKVSVYRTPSGTVWAWISNTGIRDRDDDNPAAGDTPTGMKPEPEDVNAARYVYQPGVAVVRLDGDGRVVRTGSVSHVSEPVHMVNDPYHENYGRAYVDVMWDGDGVVRSFVFTSDIRPA